MEDRRRWFRRAERGKRSGRAKIDKTESGTAVRACNSSYRVCGPIQGEMRMKTSLNRKFARASGERAKS
jgi:hypothetical protein